MKFDFRESRIISNGNIKVKISPNVTTVRRDDRAAVGLAWTGRNLILDEALAGPKVGDYSWHGTTPGP